MNENKHMSNPSDVEETVEVSELKIITFTLAGKEYGIDKVEMQKDALSSDDVVLIHDDLLATGGSMVAAIELVKKFQPRKIYVNFLIELRMEGLQGREALAGNDLTTLLTIEE